MNLREIAGMALDEIESDGVAQDGIGDAFKAVAGKIKGIGGSKGVPSAKVPSTPGGGGKGGDVAHALKMSTNDPSSQLTDLDDHDKSRHDGHFDPNTMSCKLRDKMAEAMTAMGRPIDDAVKARLGEKAVKAGIEAAKSHQGGGADDALKVIRNLNKKRKSIKDKDSSEYKAVEAELNQKRDEYLRQMVGQAECAAIDGIIQKAKNPSFTEKVKNWVKGVRDKIFGAKQNGEQSPVTEAQEVALGKIEETWLGVEPADIPENEPTDEPWLGVEPTDIPENEPTEETPTVQAEGSEYPESGSDTDASSEEGAGEETETETTIEAEQPEDGEETEQSAEDPDVDGEEEEQQDPSELQQLAEKLRQEKSGGKKIDEVQAIALAEAIAENFGEEYVEQLWEKALAKVDDPRQLDDPDFRTGLMEDIGDEMNAPKNTRKSRGDLENAVKDASAEYRELVKNDDGTEESAAKIREAQKALLEAKQKLEDRKGTPDGGDLLEDLDNAENVLRQREAELQSVKDRIAAGEKVGKDDLSNAEAAVEEAKNKVDTAREAFEGYEDPSTAEQQSEGGVDAETRKAYDALPETFREKSYIDVSEMGFFEGMMARFKASAEGKAVVTKLDKMNGRFDEIKAADDARQKQMMDSLKQATMGNAVKSLSRDFLEKKKAHLENKLKGDALFNDPEYADTLAALDELNSGKSSADVRAKMEKMRNSRNESAAKVDLTAARIDTEAAKAENTGVKTQATLSDQKRKEEMHAVNLNNKTQQGRNALIKMGLEPANATEEEKALAEQNKKKLDNAVAKQEIALNKAKGTVLDKTIAEADPGLMEEMSRVADEMSKSGDPILIARASQIKNDLMKVLKQTKDAGDAYKAVHQFKKLLGVNDDSHGRGISDDKSGGSLPKSDKPSYRPIDKQALDSAIGSGLSGDDASGGMGDQEEQDKTSQINKCLSDNKLTGASVASVDRGPVFSTFKLTKATNYDERTISAMVSRLQTALGVNKGVTVSKEPDGSVAIQVMNKNPKQVNFGAIFKSQEWAAAKKNMNLPIILGDDGHGKPLIVDLADEIHMLIGGATGQGKSVMMNSIIGSLIAAKDAGELDIEMIDPKAMEFAQYEDIPHLLRKPCMNPAEMPARIKDFESRMMAQKDALAEAGRKDGTKYPDVWAYNKAHPESPMKPAVLIIDEAAQVLSDKDSKETLSRILAMGRAPGFSVILATQRPSREVMSSKALANVESRIAFKTADDRDSETILGVGGAENLNGRGDMLFRRRNGSFGRHQGAYMSSAENAHLNNEVIKAHGKTPPKTPPSSPAGSPPKNDPPTTPPGGGGGGGNPVTPPSNPTRPTRPTAPKPAPTGGTQQQTPSQETSASTQSDAPSTPEATVMRSPDVMSDADLETEINRISSDPSGSSEGPARLAELKNEKKNRDFSKFQKSLSGDTKQKRAAMKKEIAKTPEQERMFDALTDEEVEDLSKIITGAKSHDDAGARKASSSITDRFDDDGYRNVSDRKFDEMSDDDLEAELKSLTDDKTYHPQNAQTRSSAIKDEQKKRLDDYAGKMTGTLAERFRKRLAGMQNGTPQYDALLDQYRKMASAHRASAKADQQKTPAQPAQSDGQPPRSGGDQ